MRKVIAVTLLTLIPFLSIIADDYLIEEWGYLVSVPVAFQVNDSSDLSKLSFISPDGSTVLKINSFTGDSYTTVQQLFEEKIAPLDCQVDYAEYSYLNFDAILADVIFVVNEAVYHGWFLYLNGDDWDYSIYCYSSEEHYEQVYQLIFSCLDSFMPGPDSFRSPGAVSTFYSELPGNNIRQIIPPGSLDISYYLDLETLDASQIVIEREAEIMTAYIGNEELFYQAWDRYYSLIYRDSYLRFKPIHEAIIHSEIYSEDLETYARNLLSYLQGFEYQDIDTLSGLLAPVSAVVNSGGDCDSRSLAYLILMNYVGVDGIFLVSHQYSHAMAAIDLNISNAANYQLDGVSFVIADSVSTFELGQMSERFSDAGGWIPIIFY